MIWRETNPSTKQWYSSNKPLNWYAHNLIDINPSAGNTREIIIALIAHKIWLRIRRGWTGCNWTAIQNEWNALVCDVSVRARAQAENEKEQTRKTEKPTKQRWASEHKKMCKAIMWMALCERFYVAYKRGNFTFPLNNFPKCQQTTHVSYMHSVVNFISTARMAR